MAMLREFLCLQTLIGRLLVIAPMLALFLVPLGFGVNSVVPSWPWWSLGAVPIVAMLLALAWIGLSLHECISPNATPWALTPTRLWFDRCCLDPRTPQSIASGVAGFPRFLSKSDNMVAFVSPDYFRSLWCAP